MSTSGKITDKQLAKLTRLEAACNNSRGNSALLGVSALVLGGLGLYFLVPILPAIAAGLSLASFFTLFGGCILLVIGVVLLGAAIGYACAIPRDIMGTVLQMTTPISDKIPATNFAHHGRAGVRAERDEAARGQLINTNRDPILEKGVG